MPPWGHQREKLRRKGWARVHCRPGQPLSGLLGTSSTLHFALLHLFYLSCLLEGDMEREEEYPPGDHLERQLLWLGKWGSNRIDPSLLGGWRRGGIGSDHRPLYAVPRNHGWGPSLSPLEMNCFQRSNIKNKNLFFGGKLYFHPSISKHLPPTHYALHDAWGNISTYHYLSALAQR